MPEIKIPIHVHFTSEQLENLVLVANRRRLSRAEVIRDAVNCYLAAERPRPRPRSKRTLK